MLKPKFIRSKDVSDMLKDPQLMVKVEEQLFTKQDIVNDDFKIANASLFLRHRLQYKIYDSEESKVEMLKLLADYIQHLH